MRRAGVTIALRRRLEKLEQASGTAAQSLPVALWPPTPLPEDWDAWESASVASQARLVQSMRDDVAHHAAAQEQQGQQERRQVSEHRTHVPIR